MQNKCKFFTDNEQSKSEQLIESHNNVEFDTVKVLCGNGSQSCADGNKLFAIPHLQ
jgi:hypothetical protein